MGRGAMTKSARHSCLYVEVIIRWKYRTTFLHLDFQEQMHHSAYNEKSDIWSLGCLVYEMCALHPPFLAKNQRELAVRIRRGAFARLPSVYSNELQEVLEFMLQVSCELFFSD